MHCDLLSMLANTWISYLVPVKRPQSLIASMNVDVWSWLGQAGLGQSYSLWVRSLSADLRWSWLTPLHVSRLPAAGSGMFSWSWPRCRGRNWNGGVQGQTSACDMCANKLRGWAQGQSVREITDRWCGQGCGDREERWIGVFNAVDVQ